MLVLTRPDTTIKRSGAALGLRMEILSDGEIIDGDALKGWVGVALALQPLEPLGVWSLFCLDLSHIVHTR